MNDVERHRSAARRYAPWKCDGEHACSAQPEAAEAETGMRGAAVVVLHTTMWREGVGPFGGALAVSSEVRGDAALAAGRGVHRDRICARRLTAWVAAKSGAGGARRPLRHPGGARNAHLAAGCWACSSSSRSSGRRVSRGAGALIRPWRLQNDLGEGGRRASREASDGVEAVEASGPTRDPAQATGMSRALSRARHRRRWAEVRSTSVSHSGDPLSR